eukprot:scaffold341_cov368-Pavlova_lutheri.AAC.5
MGGTGWVQVQEHVFRPKRTRRDGFLVHAIHPRGPTNRSSIRTDPLVGNEPEPNRPPAPKRNKTTTSGRGQDNRTPRIPRPIQSFVHERADPFLPSLATVSPFRPPPHTHTHRHPPVHPQRKTRRQPGNALASSVGRDASSHARCGRVEDGIHHDDRPFHPPSIGEGVDTTRGTCTIDRKDDRRCGWTKR